MSVVLAILLLAVIGLLVVLVMRKPAPLPLQETLSETERRLREHLEGLRSAQEQTNALQRQELNASLATASRSTAEQLNHAFQKMDEQLRQMSAVGVGVKDLAGSVTLFSKMLGNVKSRGTWAEWQLGNILSDMLAPGQFAQNVHPNPRAPKRVVEYAIALPGSEAGKSVWLPIDSKFPREDYERLIAATEAGNREQEEAATKALAERVKGFAREVRDAYILPPYTTNFAILFLPTEGIYQEILKQFDTVEFIQQQYKVLLAGPTTLASLINALQMGFQTLAVQKNTVQVMETLQKVKKSLGDFEDTQVKTKKNLEAVLAALEKEQTKVQALKRALKSVSTDEEASQEEEEEHA